MRPIFIQCKYIYKCIFSAIPHLTATDVLGMWVLSHNYTSIVMVKFCFWKTFPNIFQRLEGKWAKPYKAGFWI